MAVRSASAVREGAQEEVRGQVEEAGGGGGVSGEGTEEGAVARRRERRP